MDDTCLIGQTKYGLQILGCYNCRWQFIDDFNSRQILEDNDLFDLLNTYHQNIKLTIEVNPSKFLDIKLTNINGACKFNVYRKINGDYYRSKRISSNFDKEIPLTKEKIMNTDYPLRFINSVVNEFLKGKKC